MGKVTIEIPEEINITIKADSFIEAVSKLKEMDSKKTKLKIDSIKKFKGIGNSNSNINKEDWYNQ